MNKSDVAARLHELPPALPDQLDRFQQVKERVRKRRARRLAVTTVVAVTALAVVVPTVLQLRSGSPGEPSGDIANDPSAPQTSPHTQATAVPGAERVIKLSTPLTTEGTGTEAVQLGERPAGANAVSSDLRCLSAGTFTWPDGASMTCSAEDIASTSEDHAVSPGYIIELEAGQSEIVIEAGPSDMWQIVTTYVRTEDVAWGVNARGETFGVPNENGSPDLVAIGSPGLDISYGRRVDLNAGPRNPEEAGLWMRNGELHAIPTYAEDGTTIVGTFEFSGSTTAGESDSVTGSGGADDIRLVNGAPPGGATNGSASGRLSVTAAGCVHLDTKAGRRWLILPWGVHLAGTPSNGRLQSLDGTPLAELNDDATFTGQELSDQVAKVACATSLPPLYVTMS